MGNKLPMYRRFRNTMLVLLSQAMLVALAIAWVTQMGIIAANGSVYFIENNPIILWIELIGSVLITIFAIFMLATQIRRLGERRKNDRTTDS